MPSRETKYLWQCGECIFSKRYHFTKRIPAVHLSADLSSIDSFLQISESEPVPEANVREPIGDEPNGSFCDCRSARKTKQKNRVGSGCPCRTANLPCVQKRCKCGTGRKQCANRVSSFYCVCIYSRWGEDISFFILYFFRMLTFKLFTNKIYRPVPWKDKDATLKTQGRKSRQVIFSAR